VHRKDWRLVINMHCAEDDEQALREVQYGERQETVTYFEDTLGRPPGRSQDPLREGVKAGNTLVGSPETVAKGIQTLVDRSQGGIGGVMFRSHEWATHEQTKRCYELFARWVMPKFQGQLEMQTASRDWCRENRKTIFGPNVAAIQKAYTDAGKPVPEEYKTRLAGGRDVK
jgi:limonene 1,2-monooxygenase